MGMKCRGYFMVDSLAEHIRREEKYLILLKLWGEFQLAKWSYWNLTICYQHLNEMP